MLSNKSDGFINFFQVSFDVAWSPDCIDGRCYDAEALSKVVDFLVVMAYDEQSQIKSADCVAKANSPLKQTKAGKACEFIFNSVLACIFFLYNFKLTKSTTQICKQTVLITTPNTELCEVYYLIFVIML